MKQKNFVLFMCFMVSFVFMVTFNMCKPAVEILAGSDEELLAQCDVHIYKASGPGGQHRNKVSSAVRLRHRPSGISATANDSRSQHSNRTLAMRRLRMNIALKLRRSAGEDSDGGSDAEVLPVAVAECMRVVTKGPGAGLARLTIGRKNPRFWQIAAYLLDILDEEEGRLSSAGDRLGITTGNLTAAFKSQRHLLAEVQKIRKRHGLGSVK